MSSFHNILKENISKLDEKNFTREIVIPLIEKVHPGEIEYTHSPIEVGRDIVSYGQDFIDRPHILCVQVKTKISYGAESIGRLKNVATVAKDEGVILSNGSKVYPNEVWILSSKPFTDKDRRQVKGILTDLDRKNIKIIALDELIKLLVEHAPDLLTIYSKFNDVNIANLIAKFSIHHESRAFGFIKDKYLFDFYVPVTFAPHTNYAHLVLKNKMKIEVPSGRIVKEFQLFELMENQANLNDIQKFKRIIRDFIKISDKDICFFKGKKSTHCIKSEIKIINFDKVLEDYSKSANEYKIKYNELEKKYKIKFGEEYIKNHPELAEIALALKAVTIEYVCKLKYDETLLKIIEKTLKSLNKCPAILGKKPKVFINAYKNILILEKLSIFLLAKGYLKIEDEYHGLDKEVLRVLVKEPLNALSLDDLLLIQGQPGCGKTTFLRVLTIRLLETGAKVLFVSCSTISNNYKNKSLNKIVNNFAEGTFTKIWNFKECILILDGLDEATFDLSEKIKKSSNQFKKIIVSSRTAHQSSIRNDAFVISLSLLSRKERNQFFKNWFDNDKVSYNVANELISKHHDIDYHTRLPLISTITASLIQSGYKPTTRAEIYDFRLDLLLSRWDKAREVERIRIDDPKAKRRFLNKLAYDVHSKGGRRRIFDIETIKGAFEDALGYWGYLHDFNDFLEDLIIASGIIIKERPGTYSFGHLSFQEHLVAEYLIEKNFTPSQIASKMGSDWWREPLFFYASIKGDLKDLLEYIDKTDGLYTYAGVVYYMLKYAPFSPPGAIEVVKDMAEEYKF
jgi:energy-coupling factor transporter ATP-binding protein EcfA2